MPVVYSIGTGIPNTPGAGSGSQLIDIILDPVQQLGYEQIPVWDGPTYLYTIHRMHFRGTYNPKHFSWNLAQASALQDYTGVYPTLQPNQLPPTTNNAIKHYLLHPRGTIIYNIGGIPNPSVAGTVVITNGIEAMRSPANAPGGPVSYMTDCKNGPIPLHCNVVEVKGTKTWLVDWAIECYVNESYIFRQSSTLSALLSQRWTVEEDLDEDFFATRTIVGHAIFRSDRLQVLNAVPDDFRAWLMNPLQNKFKRNVQQVNISEDGTRLDYVLVDREVAFNLVPSVVGVGVTRIEATYTQGYNRPLGIEGAVGQSIGVLLDVGSSVLEGKSPASAIVRGIQSGGKILFDLLPRYYQVLNVKVWGNPTSTRFNLANVALSVFFAKNSASITLASGKIDITENLMGKYVELNFQALSGPIQGTLKLGANVLLSSPFVSQNDLISNVTQNTAFLQPLPPLDHGTRSNMYSAVTQVLTGADDTAPSPNNARQARSLNPQGINF